MNEFTFNGRVFETVADVRAATMELMDRYNAEWLLAENGYLGPNDATRNRNLANH